MFKACLVPLMALSLPCICSAQVSDELKRRIDLGNKLNQIFDVTKQVKLANELEILDEQIEKLKLLRKDYLEKVTKFQKQLDEQTKGLSKEETRKFTSQFFDKTQTSTVKQIEKILLPHQVKRLNQIAIQRRFAVISRGDRFDMLIAISKELKLSKSELESFEKNVKKEKERYEKNVRDLIRKTDMQILKHLPPAARKQLKEMVGEIYK